MVSGILSCSNTLVVAFEEGREADDGAGNMQPESMITKRIQIDDVVEEGFKALIKDKDNQVKILIDLT